jgi:hypothetical protein
MTAIKLNKLDWLLWAINHMKHERVHVCFSHFPEEIAEVDGVRSWG